jgi:hypothetical protein
MRSSTIAIALVVLLSAAAIRAQEDAGAADSEGDADAGAAATEAAPPPPPTAAASIAGQQTLTPSDVLKLDPNLYEGQERRLIITKQRKLKVLEKIMSKEGPEYDAVKDTRYENRLFGGVFLDVAAAGAFVASLALGLHLITDDHGWEDCEGTANEAECRATAREKLDKHEATVAVLLPVGVVLAAVGIPLTIAASRGHKRQKILRRKDEILEECRMLRLDFTASSGSGGPGGGLMLSESF